MKKKYRPKKFRLEILEYTGEPLWWCYKVKKWMTLQEALKIKGHFSSSGKYHSLNQVFREIDKFPSDWSGEIEKIRHRKVECYWTWGPQKVPGLRQMLRRVASYKNREVS